MEGSMSRLRRQSDQDEDGPSVPEHLRRPSFPPPSGPLPPTPESQRAGTPDRLSGRPFLPSSSLPLWSSKRPDATVQHIRVRGSTIMSPSSGNKIFAGYEGPGASENRRPATADRKAHERDFNGKSRTGPVSPSYPSSATLQNSAISSSGSSSSNNVPIPLPRYGSVRLSPELGDKSKSSYASTSSGKSSSSSHHRSLSQPIPALASSIRKFFNSDAHPVSDLEKVPENVGPSHQRSTSAVVPWTTTSSEEAIVDAKLTGTPLQAQKVANFSRKPVFTDRYGNPATTSLVPRQAAAAAAADRGKSSSINTSSQSSRPYPATTPLQLANSPNSNRTGSSILSAENFGYFPFLTESNSPRNNRSHRSSVNSSRGRAPSAGISTDDIVRDLRSLSRLSGLSHVSGGAAFIISEDGDASDLGRRSDDVEDTNPYSRIGVVSTVHETTEYPVDSEKGASTESTGDKSKKALISSDEKLDEDKSVLEKTDSNVSSVADNQRQSSSSGDSSSKNEALITSAGFRQLTPGNMRIHPADQRFSHTYRIRQSAGDDPVLIPVYNFPTPGAFPNRNHMTLPTPNPGFSKHKKAIDSMDIFEGEHHGSNDSQEGLIPEKPGAIYKHHQNYSQFNGPSAGSSDESREKYLASGTFAMMSTTAGPKGQITGSPGGTWKREVGSSLADTSNTGAPEITISNAADQQRMTAHERFERQHAPQFMPTVHDTYKEQPIETQKDCHIIVMPQRKYAPHLFRPDNTYVGDDIDQERWPDRYSRQQKIGRYLLIMCTIMPPLWVILAAGGLDVFVNEVTDGVIWGVGKKEKRIAAWLGGTFFTGLLIAVIIVGVLVL